jgi:dipicolinate synthase subunit A
MMVIGYGRVGQILSNMLKGIGAKVYAVVNKNEAAARAASHNHEVIKFEDFESHLKYADIIFNTVPHMLLNRHNMKNIRKETLIIDLASPPYGVELNDSREFGLKVLYTNSLPGKIAPVTTAAYMLNTVNHIVEEIEGLCPGEAAQPAGSDNHEAR